MILPAVFTSPETSWAFGASGTAAFKTSHKNDSLTRTSTIQTVGIYTLNKQYIFGLDATIYFPKEKYILYTSLSYNYFPDKFWGIGPYTKNQDKERYSASQAGAWMHLKRKVWKRLFAGLLMDYKYVYDFRYWAHGNIDTNNIPGKSPYSMSGVGLSLGYDTRNSAFYPTKGFFVQSQWINYNKIFGSGFNNVKWMAEGRYYQTIYKGVVSATQIYGLVNTGNIPLKSLAMLGGTDNLRGYYQGRFRDNVYASLITELRFSAGERFGFVIFGGTGNVSHTLKSFDFNSLKFSAGAGVRLVIKPKERLNIRIDYGYADKVNNGIYFTIGEAF